MGTMETDKKQLLEKGPGAQRAGSLKGREPKGPGTQRAGSPKDWEPKISPNCKYIPLF